MNQIGYRNIEDEEEDRAERETAVELVTNIDTLH